VSSLNVVVDLTASDDEGIQGPAQSASGDFFASLDAHDYANGSNDLVVEPDFAPMEHSPEPQAPPLDVNYFATPKGSGSFVIDSSLENPWQAHRCFDF